MNVPRGVDVNNDFLAPSQAARLLGLSAERIRQLMREGKLEFTLTPLGRLIRRQAVLNLLDERARGGKRE